MIQISQIKLPVASDEEALFKKVRRLLQIGPGEPLKITILRRSVDARKKPELFYVYTVDVQTDREGEIRKKAGKFNRNNIMFTDRVPYTPPPQGKEKLLHRPVVVGSGPAGLYAAWLLARGGYAPLVIERGETALLRREKVEKFWTGGPLDENCNVQFGEGGAGTFSDGKLNTSVKDPRGRIRQILELFVSCGAPREILYEQKPHLGTDQLIGIVTRLRQKIERLGGTFRFQAKLTDLSIEKGVLRAIQINGEQWLETEVLILAIGHSARDTFSLLKKRGLSMQAKAFAVGVRLEHPQRMINLAQYGTEDPVIGPAPYKVTAQLPNGRGVYSFCMCPGGYVVNASSEEGYLAVNGMSYQARGSENANSAMIVTVTPKDYLPYAQTADDALAGVRFQRMLESRAHAFHQGKIPVQTFADFREGKTSVALGDVAPCIRGQWDFAPLHEIFPAELSRSIVSGITACGTKIRGFDRPDALLSGVESRTSSPVRITRNERLESNIAGIYPCGEGAGYAGGITSAALDGLKVAEAVYEKYMKFR